MALLFALPIRFGLISPTFGDVVPTLWQLLEVGLSINLLLFAFNLMPIPPLDGFSILQGLLPPDLAYQLEGIRQYGTFILLGVIVILPIVGLDIFRLIIFPVMSGLASLLIGG